jgi:hypothetical protein
LRYPVIVLTCGFWLYMQSAHVIEHYAGGLLCACNTIHTYATLIHSNILYTDPGHMSPGKCSQAGPSWVPSASVHSSVTIWHCWAAHGPSEAAAAPPRAPRTADSRSRMGGSHAMLAKRVIDRPPDGLPTPPGALRARHMHPRSRRSRRRRLELRRRSLERPLHWGGAPAWAPTAASAWLRRRLGEANDCATAKRTGRDQPCVRRA